MATLQVDEPSLEQQFCKLDAICCMKNRATPAPSGESQEEGQFALGSRIQRAHEYTFIHGLQVLPLSIASSSWQPWPHSQEIAIYKILK